MRALIVLGLLSVPWVSLQAAALHSAAPKFSLKDSQQRPRSLADFKGKVVFINFWASWCAPCLVELPELNRLAARYAEKNVKVLAINVDQDRAAANAILARLQLKRPAFEILWDPQSKAVSAYKIETMPASFILDAGGIVRYTHPGFHPAGPAAWQIEIDQLLREKL